MTFEELKKNLSNLVNGKITFGKDSIWCLGVIFYKNGTVLTDCGDSYCDYELAANVPYQAMYKLAEFLWLYRGE